MEIEDNVNEGLEILRKKGFELIVITNQPDIARGNLDFETLVAINKLIECKTGILHFYVCIHDDLDFCVCRKPKPGLILKAAHELDIDLRQSYLIGDRKSDIEAANNAGCIAIYIDRNYLELGPEPPFRSYKSLLEFALTL